MHTNRSLSFFKTLSGWKLEWLEDLLTVLKTKQFTLIEHYEKEEEEVCARCEHYKRTAFGMPWCSAEFRRIDDYEHEERPGASIPEFERIIKDPDPDNPDDFVEMTRHYTCNHFEKKPDATPIPRIYVKKKTREFGRLTPVKQTHLFQEGEE